MSRRDPEREMLVKQGGMAEVKKVTQVCPAAFVASTFEFRCDYTVMSVYPNEL
jgi:hypothetical protein